MQPSHLPRPDGLCLAYHHREGAGPTLVFFPGYMSDLAGIKAVAIDEWAAANGRAMLRFDYSGCGASEGEFEDGTLTRWRDDALHLIDTLTSGPLTLVGSSMGGWIALLVALARPDRIAALVGIAVAADFTDWGFTEPQKLTLLSEGRLVEPGAPGEPPTVTTRRFWQSGEAHRLLHGPIAIDAPARLLHGQRDAVVPWHHSPHLAGRLRSADVQTILVKDGDHRLSRPEDIALLLRTIETLPA